MSSSSSSLRRPTKEARPTLRVVSEETCEATATPPGPSPQMSLTELYEVCFTPLWINGLGCSPKTDVIYRDALNWWKRLTGDPPLSQIDDYTTAAFVSELMKQPGRKAATMAIGTVRKHCQQIDKLLAFAGPKTRDRRGRKNQCLIDDPPLCEKPRADEDPPDGDFTLDEVERIIRACRGCTAPRVAGVDPARWWEAFVIVACYTGLRVSQLMGLEYRDLRGQNILVWARTSKGRRGKKQYLSREALAEIEAIRTPRVQIFEYPNWSRNPRSHREVFKRILCRAGLPKERQFGFNGFRKMHSTLLADQDQGAMGVEIAKQSLGHTTTRTTLGHYINGNVQQKLTAQAIERLPSPRGRSRPTNDLQRPLFDYL